MFFFILYKGDKMLIINNKTAINILDLSRLSRPTLVSCMQKGLNMFLTKMFLTLHQPKAPKELSSSLGQRHLADFS